MSKYMRARTRELNRLLTQEKLQSLYWQDGLTIREIADLHQCSLCAVYNRLTRYGIQCRSYGTWAQAELVPLTLHEEQVLTGALLGDGCIYLRPDHVNPIYIQTSKHREFLEFVQDELPDLLKGQSITCTKKGVHRGYYIKSRANPALQPWYAEWYREGGKTLADQASLSPAACLHWYLGDGNYSKSTGVIRLFAFAFPRAKIEQVLFPQLQIFQPYLSRMDPPTVNIPRRCVGDFLDYIGPCPVVSYRHKWGSGVVSEPE
jgi:hypothetical protein